MLKWAGIPCGVGFAPTRTLAKIANHIGKKRPGGVFVMPKDANAVLETLPVEEVWGGGATASRAVASGRCVVCRATGKMWSGLLSSS